jgi:hypothetical protein
MASKKKSNSSFSIFTSAGKNKQTQEVALTSVSKAYNSCNERMTVSEVHDEYAPLLSTTHRTPIIMTDSPAFIAEDVFFGGLAPVRPASVVDKGDYRSPGYTPITGGVGGVIGVHSLEPSRAGVVPARYSDSQIAIAGYHYRLDWTAANEGEDVIITLVAGGNVLTDIRLGRVSTNDPGCHSINFFIPVFDPEFVKISDDGDTFFRSSYLDDNEGGEPEISFEVAGAVSTAGFTLTILEVPFFAKDNGYGNSPCS